mmetsp:Transcript_18967/g.28117  ORF Transcript_18967/g.28117 Transcript_18967/m.28117 type:complete len:287 (+) Transcript_18967:1677-2537(+)
MNVRHIGNFFGLVKVRSNVPRLKRQDGRAYNVNGLPQIGDRHPDIGRRTAFDADFHKAAPPGYKTGVFNLLRRINNGPRGQISGNDQGAQGDHSEQTRFGYLHPSHLLRLLHESVDRGDLDEQRDDALGVSQSNQPLPSDARHVTGSGGGNDRSDAHQEVSKGKEIEIGLLGDFHDFGTPVMKRSRVQEAHNDNRQGTKGNRGVIDRAVIRNPIHLARVGRRNKLVQIHVLLLLRTAATTATVFFFDVVVLFDKGTNHLSQIISRRIGLTNSGPFIEQIGYINIAH